MTEEINLMEVITVEIQNSAKVSKDFQQQIKTAKTNYKRQFYKKKLHKNNEQLADMLITLQKLQNTKVKNAADTDTELK